MIWGCCWVWIYLSSALVASVHWGFLGIHFLIALWWSDHWGLDFNLNIVRYWFFYFFSHFDANLLLWFVMISCHINQFGKSSAVRQMLSYLSLEYSGKLRGLWPCSYQKPQIMTLPPLCLTMGPRNFSKYVAGKSRKTCNLLSKHYNFLY